MSVIICRIISEEIISEFFVKFIHFICINLYLYMFIHIYRERECNHAIISTISLFKKAQKHRVYLNYIRQHESHLLFYLLPI